MASVSYRLKRVESTNQLLKSGSRLGPYEILAKLGEGGMGEVYRASDTRLGRDVALKVLPARASADAAAEARFDREARAIAALNHPNICALYDVGHDAGRTFLVMELLEGETLHQWLARGPLESAMLVNLSIALAEGLNAAHSRGLVHRDLKPANIFLTKHGQTKILDFGLAKAVDAPDDETRLARCAADVAGLRGRHRCLHVARAAARRDGRRALGFVLARRSPL